MRRKRGLPGICCVRQRITSACAEKTVVCKILKILLKKNLHICGENIKISIPIAILTEKPLLVQRKPKFVKTLTRTVRKTSTYAEKTLIKTIFEK